MVDDGLEEHENVYWSYSAASNSRVISGKRVALSRYVLLTTDKLEWIELARIQILRLKLADQKIMKKRIVQVELFETYAVEPER